MIDVTQEINTVRRTVGTRTLEAGEARCVIISRVYDAPLNDVWDACTNPERIPRWFLPVSGDLRLGGRFQLEGNAGGTIERCDPPKGFSATWEFGGGVSWIEVRLASEPDGRTRLELEHIAKVDEHWEQFGPGAVGIGWDMVFMGLGQHLSSDQPLEPAQAVAWVASSEGRQFITLASERWRDADIAGGADEVTATGAAERTTAAYLPPEPPPAS
jgi:uncharacterized protein YndB with AHSA1/START domain